MINAAVQPDASSRTPGTPRYSGGLVGRNPAVPVIDGEAHGLLDGSRVETGNRGLSPSRSIAVLTAI
jgi:hypothetical protein